MKQILLILLVIFTYSCGLDSVNPSNDKEKELLEKELELTKKELELEKQKAELENKSNVVTDEISGVKVEESQENPVWVVKQIFKAAKTKDFSLLEKLCDPEGEGDGDTKKICNIINTPDAQKEFIEYFEKGEVIGRAEVFENQSAKVKFKFGPEGNRDETMILVKRNNKWYLGSF